MEAIVVDFQRKFGKFAFAMERELNMAEFWDFLPKSGSAMGIKSKRFFY